LQQRVEYRACSVESTNLVTLHLRAYESRSRRTILGDHTAAAAVDRLDDDFKRLV
jgi:O-methyltransferase involved in polyketide biosynthesis